MSAPTPYRVRVEVGSHVFDVESGDAPDVNVPRVDLPLAWGWQIPESVEFFPTQANPTTGALIIACPDLTEVDDITVGDLVLINMWLNPDGSETEADVWQRFRGVVSQVEVSLDATAALEDRTPRHKMTAYLTDPTWLLADMLVGMVDWPEEDIEARVARIVSEAGLTLDVITELSSMGILAARNAAPTDALAALRAAFKDDANENDSFLNPEGTGTVSYFGRPVFTYDPDDQTVYVRVFERRVATWPAQLGPDGSLVRKIGEEGALDGSVTLATGKWSRVKADRYTYVVVDEHVEGDDTAPGAIPYVRTTALVDVLPTNHSETLRNILAESLLPDDPERAGAWRTDTIRHKSYLDPDPVQGWAGGPPMFGDQLLTLLYSYARLRPVIVDQVDPTLTIDGRRFIGGTLTAVRLVIPPGGRFYFDLTLRPDLFPYPPPTVPAVGVGTYADLDPTVTYAELDPGMTYRDLRLLGD